MITLAGIFSESFGGTCTIRGYAKYTDIINLSYPHPHYQRPEDAQHIEDISKFIISGSNSFSPEVVLAYTTEYDYYVQGANSEVDAISDIRSGKGFASNKNGVSFKKQKAVDNGFLYEIRIPEGEENKPFRRVDGNHRLKAFEKLVAEGQVKSSYLIPFCIILFAEGTPLKDEKIIFHTKIESEEEMEAFYNSVTKALTHADIVGDDEISIASGLFFLLTSLYYKIELDYLDAEHTVEKYKNNLLHWAKKYRITDVQNDSAGNAVINANCIKDIFDKSMFLLQSKPSLCHVAFHQIMMRMNMPYVE